MLNPNPGKVVNNLIIELHVPDFKIVKDFYAMFGFYIRFTELVDWGQ